MEKIEGYLKPERAAQLRRQADEVLRESPTEEECAVEEMMWRAQAEDNRDGADQW